LSLALFEHRYADYAAERCHADACDCEEQPHAQSNEHRGTLHSVGDLPYSRTARRIGDVIGFLLYLRNDVIPTKQRERDADYQIYERAHDADERAGRGPVTACNGQYR
jgi:hypothetical protein